MIHLPIKRIASITWIIASIIGAVNLEAKVFNLYYLGGQSNMTGFGQNSDLPEDLQGPVKGAMIIKAVRCRIFQKAVAREHGPNYDRDMDLVLNPMVNQPLFK